MTRRVVAAVIPVMLAALLAGCSSDSRIPARSQPAHRRPRHPPVSRGGEYDVRNVDCPAFGGRFFTAGDIYAFWTTYPGRNPWPAGLTPAQVSDAKAALDVYGRYQTLVGVAGSNPAKDWTEEVSSVATAAAKSQLIEALTQTAARGQRTTGSAQISPYVTGTQPSLVIIQDCVDSSNSDFLDSEVKSIKAPDAAGTYYRHPATAQVVQVQDGGWRVAIASDDWSTKC